MKTIEASKTNWRKIVAAFAFVCWTIASLLAQENNSIELLNLAKSLDPNTKKGEWFTYIQQWDTFWTTIDFYIRLLAK